MKGASFFAVGFLLMVGCVHLEGTGDKSESTITESAQEFTDVQRQNQAPDGSGNISVETRDQNGTISNQTLNAFDTLFNVQDCDGQRNKLWHYEKEPPPPPEGYTPISDNPTQAGYYAYIMLMDCETLVLNNATVLDNVNIAWTGLPVHPADAVEHGSGSDSWMYEFFTDSPILHETMLAVGMPTVMAEFSYQEQLLGGRTFILAVLGEVWYEAELGSQFSETGDHMVQADVRLHHRFDDNPRWMDYEIHYPIKEMGAPDIPITFTAYAGDLEAIMGSADMISGRSYQFPFTADFKFGRLK